MLRQLHFTRIRSTCITSFRDRLHTTMHLYLSVYTMPLCVTTTTKMGNTSRGYVSRNVEQVNPTYKQHIIYAVQYYVCTLRRKGAGRKAARNVHLYVVLYIY